MIRDASPNRRSAAVDRSSRGLGRMAGLAVALEVLIGAGALFGGGQFILAPDGHIVGMPTSYLAGSPFRDYLAPGIILFTCIGVAPLVAAALALLRHPLAPLAAVAVGLTLVGWITVEMLILSGPGSIAWAIYLVLGTATAALGLAWRSWPGKQP